MTETVTPSDHDLLLGLRDGDEAAFTALYRRWQGPLYRYALRVSGSPALAEDVTQEVFMALLRRNEGYDPSRGELSSYLHGIARNLARGAICPCRTRPEPMTPWPTSCAASARTWCGRGCSACRSTTARWWCSATCRG